MASAGSFQATSAAMVLLLCLCAAGGDRNEESDGRGALSPGLSDKGLVTKGKLRDLAPEKAACNVVKPMPPGVRYIRSALFCVLKQYMMDSWAGSEELALQLSQLRRRERMPRLGEAGRHAEASVQEELEKSLERVLKEAEPTETDGPKALLTSDERFRLQPLLEDEYAFWKENGEAIMRHWKADSTSALQRYYAIVSEGPDPTSQKWALTREVIGGRQAADQAQKKYVLTGQDSTGADAKEDGDHWPQYLYFSATPSPGPTEAPGWFAGWRATTQAPTTTPLPRLVATYEQFYAAVEKDVALLEKLNVPAYSLVVRMAPANGKHSWTVLNNARYTLEEWEAFPQFRGAGIVFKTMHWPPAKTFDISAGKAFEVSVEIVDYLRGAKEKAAPGSRSDSLLGQVRRKFRPFTFDRKGGTPPFDLRYRCCISNPEVVQGDPSQEELEELARNEPLPQGICAAALFKRIHVHRKRRGSRF